MLILAIALPLLIGLGGLFLMDPADRPKGIGQKAIQVVRGYPYAAVLSGVILFLLVVAPIFKVRTIIRRWEDAHIPIVVKPDAYEQVAGELEKAIDGAGLDLARARAPRVREVPSKLLAAVGGASVRRLVPDQLVMLKAKSLEVTIHPSDVSIAGTKAAVAQARAAIADRLTFAEAYLTTSKEAQEVEDALREVNDPRTVDLNAAKGWLEALDKRLARLTIPYEEWEVLYRQRLQLERNLLRHAERMDKAPAPPASPRPGLLQKVRDTLSSN
jgi:hypothetical protein